MYNFEEFSACQAYLEELEQQDFQELEHHLKDNLDIDDQEIEDFVDELEDEYYNPNPIYMAYAKHSQEIEDIIETCVNYYFMGITEFTLPIDDNMSDEDIKYIKREVRNRL